MNKEEIKESQNTEFKSIWKNKEYQREFGTSKATATRDLTNLIEKGILDIRGKGKRGIHYVLSKPKMSKKEGE